MRTATKKGRALPERDPRIAASANSRRAFESQPFRSAREAALALLSDAIMRGEELPIKTGSFLGSCCAVDELTPRMRKWLDALLRRAGLPPVTDGCANV